MFIKLYGKVIKYIKENYVFIMVLALILFLGLFKLPYNIYAGGGIIDIRDRLEIAGEYQESGSFNMAYVRSLRATIPVYLLSYVFNWERESIESVKLDENDTSADMWKRELVYLEEANNNAIISAYNKAGEYIKINKEVLDVIYIDKDSDTNLQTGDIIKKVDGIEINSFDDFKKIINNHEVGDKLEIEYLRSDKEGIGYIVIRDIEGEKKAGLYLVKLYEYDVNRKIKLDFSSREGGSSGGLMLSLAIYNRLISEDITKGRKIVGTGTIDENGIVGPIGGVKYKVIGANSGKADVFFVPEGNYDEAIKFKEEKGYDLNIVKVKTLEDAIEYLRRN